MENLKIFEKENFKVRVVQVNNEPWFVAKDVCNILEIRNNSDALSRLDEDEKDIALTDTLGGSQEMCIISESGLYSLTLSSRKPEARKFKKWITSEVIPAIRKHGGYLTPEKLEKALLNPDVLITLATNLKEEQQKRIEAENKILELKPKAEFHDAVSIAENDITIRQLAKVIGTGEKRLFAWMRDNEYLMKNNEPYQQYINSGIFRSIQKSYKRNDTELLYNQTVVTGQGIIYFQKKYSGVSTDENKSINVQ